jgi:serine/threonine-protein kinase
MQNGKLGKYEIRGILGKGAMGTVYDGYDAVIDRRVAIKTMTKPDPADGEAQEELARFRREAQAAGRLAHPNIVGVYDYGEDGDVAFIVMEYAPGTELKKLLDKGSRMPPAEAVRIMQGVLAGLQYSHERGVVHRDIKPGNIILSPDGTVKIADFGIARIESSSMTQAGTVLGTPAYMSPEQFMGQTVDKRTDIYSAGVMFYQLLTGERPFDGSMSAIMHKALNTEPPKPSDLSVTAPAAFDAVVARAMATRPVGRFDSAADFSAAMKAALEAPPKAAPDPLGDDDATVIAPRAAKPAPPPQAAPPTPGPVARGGSRMGLIAGGALAVLAVAGLGAYVALPGSKQPAPPSRVQQPAPQPPPAAQPAAVAPSPPAPVPPPEQIRDALAAGLRNAACSLTQTTVQDAHVLVQGVVGDAYADALRTAATAALPAGSPDGAFILGLQHFPGQAYCGVLDLLRGASGGWVPVSLATGAAVLRDRDAIKPQMIVPDYPSWLTVDYYQSDGQVFRMVPNPSHKEVDKYLPGRTVMFSDPTWSAGAPFGTDMIVAIASSATIPATAPAGGGEAKPYLAVLSEALQYARWQGITIYAGATLVTTKP